MANLNKVQLIGRLTRDPEIKVFSNGGKVANVGFAVNNRKKNQATGAWEDVPVWLDLKAFNRDTGRKLADLIEQNLRKGQQIYVEGHLVLEEWTGKTDGEKKSKLVIHIDDLQFLEKKEGGSAMAGAGSSRSASKAASGSAEEGLEDVPF